MIHPIKEEVFISIYLIIYGIYIFLIYDLFYLVINKLKIKKVFSILFELLFCLLQIYITYKFSYNLASGYIPIYFILFIFVGLIIYIKFIKNSFIKQMTKIILLLTILYKTVASKLVHLFVSTRIIKLIKKCIIRIKQRKNKSKLSLDK